MWKLIFILAALVIFSEKAHGKYCCVCYIVSETPGLPLHYQIMSMDLLEFNLPVNDATKAMFNACSDKLHQSRKKHPALKRLGFFATKKYVDYRPRSANTFLGSASINNFRDNAPSTEEDLNCDQVRQSEFRVRLDYSEPMSAKEIQQQQDEAQGYNPKTKDRQ